VLVDADHEFVDAYGIRNVPTVVWIDEDDRIVRPNSPEFGDDQFVDFPPSAFGAAFGGTRALDRLRREAFSQRR
jgi:hypothetical protein